MELLDWNLIDREILLGGLKKTLEINLDVNSCLLYPNCYDY
jgi:hypothetical protein